MKIFAYADTHIGTNETLRELELQPDFSACYAFIELVATEKPDFVICVGDFNEQIWDGAWHNQIMRDMENITDIFLVGNHDPHRQEQVVQLDGIQFLHGHQWERATDGYVERLHQRAQQQSKYTVVAHTHSPAQGQNFMDIGSLTLSRSFGEFNDCKKLRFL